MKITIIVDAFRAFATASYALEKEPKNYYLTNSCARVSQLAQSAHDPLLIGKPEIGSILTYHIPNSPTRVKETPILGRDVIHRTAAGALGILKATDADLILGASFVNADATAAYVRLYKGAQVKIVPMGHEGTTPSFEDDLCAEYIDSLIRNEWKDLSPFIDKLKDGPGKYFFGEDQWQYPKEDFDLCIKTRRFPYVIVAKIQGNYACLKRVDVQLPQPYQV